MLSHPEMTEELTTEYICPQCGSDRTRRIVGIHPGGHYAKVECVDCSRFIKWEPKPREKAKSRRNQSKLLEQYSKGFCELCLRSKGSIPLPQVLEAHHVIPVADGGSDERDNVQIVCTACHKLIHHQRTYLGHYIHSSYPQQDERRQALYAEIIQVVEERSIKKRAAIAILNEQFNAMTRDDLDNDQLEQFLDVLKEMPIGGAV